MNLGGPGEVPERERGAQVREGAPKMAMLPGSYPGAVPNN